MDLPLEIKEYVDKNMNWDRLYFRLSRQDKDDAVKMLYYFKRQGKMK
jgi:hypothetical protein